VKTCLSLPFRISPRLSSILPPVSSQDPFFSFLKIKTFVSFIRAFSPDGFEAHLGDFALWFVTFLPPCLYSGFVVCCLLLWFAFLLNFIREVAA